MGVKGVYPVSILLVISSLFILSSCSLFQSEEPNQKVSDLPPSLSEKEVEEHIAQGESLFKESNYDQALEYFEDAIASDSVEADKEKAYESRTRILYRDGKRQEAEKALQEGLTLYPQNQYLLQIRALLQMETQEYEQARETFLTLVSLNSSDYWSYATLARVEWVLGSNLSLVDEYINISLAIRPNSEAYFTLLDVYATQLTDQEKESLFLQSIEADPTSPNAYFLLGDFYLESEKNASAEKYYRESIRATRESEKRAYYFIPYLRLAQLEFDKGEIASAQSLLLEGLEFDSDPLIVLLLARVYDAQELFVQAEEHLLSYLEVYPQDLQAQLLLGSIYLKQGKNEEAEGILAQLSTP